MAAAECVTDADCGTTLLCYTNASFAGGRTVCTCNHWYGYTGADCLELSTQTYVFTLFVVLTLVASVVLLALAGTSVLRFITHVGVHRVDSQVLTMGFAMLACVSLIAWRGTMLGILFDPAGHDTALDSDKKFHSLAPLERAMIGLSLMFCTLACLNVSLVWVKVAIDSAQMTRTGSRRLIAYRNLVVAFQLLYVLGLIALFALQLQTLVVFFSAPFLLFIIASCAYGAVKISRLLREVSKSLEGAGSSRGAAAAQQAEYLALVRRIRRTAALVSCGIVLGIVFAAAYSLIALLSADGTRSATTPDHAVHFVVVANEMIAVSVVLITGAVLLYVRANVDKAVRAHRLAAHSSFDVRTGKLSDVSSADKASTANKGVPTSKGLTAGHVAGISL